MPQEGKAKGTPEPSRSVSVTARDLATEASRTKSDVLSTAAHEMRTPLGVVSGYLSMLEDGSFGEVPGSWRSPMAKMRAKLGEVGAMVDDLLSASRIQEGAMPIKRRRADLRDLVRDAVARAAPRAE